MKFKYLMIGLLISILSLSITACSEKKNFEPLTPQTFDYDNATIYFAMTDRFKDGNPDNNNAYGRPSTDALGQNTATFNGGDFEGLTQKLEEGYFKDLGVNVLWVSAPYEQIHGYIAGGKDGNFAHYGFHGYYALDWTSMDQNFGTIDTFRKFVDTAHAQGIRVFLDVVMNHVGYPNYEDMFTYGYGGVSPDQPSALTLPKEGETFKKWTDFVDWQGENAFDQWWGDWVRADFKGYTPPGEDVFTQNLMGLPDVRTEVTEPLGLPPILVTKWAMESTDNPYALPNAAALRKAQDLSPSDYIVTWLAAWVENFGIDGFRIDTAKHVEADVWAKLKTACDSSLKTFRQNNPDNVAAAFTEDFYFLGEVWGQGLAKNYYFDNGFDALINFSFQGERKDGPAFDPSKMPKIFKNYAEALNSDPDFNVVSYLSQHDTTLYPRNKLMDGATFLMLLPGGVQIFYGDETARPFGSFNGDATMATRSPMNWDAIDTAVLEHFQKLGQFRNRNLAVGAGAHTVISESPYVFTRHYEKNGVTNDVLVYIGTEKTTEKVSLEVSSIAEEGATVRDAYTGKTYQVKNGHIEIEVHDNGIALIEMGK